MAGHLGGDLGAVRRRASSVDVVPAEVKKNNEDGAQPSAGPAPIAFGESSRAQASAHQGKLPLSPFERMWNAGIQNIARHLTFNEAASLMASDRRSRLLLYADPLLRLDEVSRHLGRLGCNVLITNIRSIDADIAQLREENRARQYRPKSNPGLSARKAQRANQESMDARWLARAVHEQGLQKLQPAIEEVVFHFASERRTGPRQGPDPLTPVPRRKSQQTVLHEALRDGNALLVRAGLREFLALPQALMPNAQKVEWLRSPLGTGMLESFGRHMCGIFKVPELQHYEAIYAYVQEIVSSPYLSAIDKQELCITPGGLDIVGHCLTSHNPAVAASIILGIHESSASPLLKRQLFSAMGVGWARPLGRIDGVITALGWRSNHAPDWVGGMLERLNGARAALLRQSAPTRAAPRLPRANPNNVVQLPKAVVQRQHGVD